MDSVKVALDVCMLKMAFARREITVKLAGEGWKRTSARMNRIVGQIKLKRDATTRSTAFHEEEPSPKIIFFEDIAIEENDCIDVGSLAARKEISLYFTTPS